MTKTTAQGSNLGQKQFWSTGPGQQWVRFWRELDVLHARVARLLIDDANPQPGEHALDIGCGAGGTTLAVARRVAPGGSAVGLDLSPPLLDTARTRSKAESLGNVTFTEADAQDWQGDGTPFDLVLSRMGAMLFADPEAAFRNILSLTRPGGRLCIAAWADTRYNGWFRDPLAAAVARLGPAEPSPNPFTPGPTAFRDIPRVTGILEKAGWSAVHAREIDTVLDVPAGVAAAVALAEHVGPIPRHLRDKGGTDADRAAILDALHTTWTKYDTAEGCQIPARFNLFTARRA